MRNAKLCCGLLVVAVAAACPATAWAQSCNAQIGGGIGQLESPPFSPGETIAIRLAVGAGNIDDGNFIVIPGATANLDCQSDTGDCFATACADAGLEVSYEGDALLSTVCEDESGTPLGIVSNNPAGGAGINEIEFTFVDAISGDPTGAAVN